MKSVRCRDLGVDCEFVASGDTNEVVITNMFAHSVEHHHDKHEHMFGDKAAALVGDMEGAIKDA